MGNFKCEEYTNLMDTFLHNMKDVMEYQGEEIFIIVKPLCDFFRIGNIGIFYYNTKLDYNNNTYYDKIIYDIKDNNLVDKNRSIVSLNDTTTGNVIIYKAYQIIGDEDWSMEEIEKIRLFLDMLYVFNGRVRLGFMCEKLTFFDAELGMPNIKGYNRFFQRKIDKNEANKYIVAFFNIRGFGAVNQLIGRELGTVVLKKYITGLKELLSDDEIVCRVGGDNFIVAFFEYNLTKVKAYLHNAYIKYDDRKNDHINIKSVAGMYRVPSSCKFSGDTIDCANKANNIARNELKQPVVFYNDEIMKQLSEDQIMEKAFPDAFKNEEFKVYYQPKVNINDYSLIGAEALCRWERDEEIILPQKFISVLEKTNNICELDFYMIKHVCMHIREWLDEGRKPVRISINLSKSHFGDDNLASHIVEIVDTYKIPHKLIEIEFVKVNSEEEYQFLKNTIFELKKDDIKVSMAGFGLENSSLNVIQDVPWDVIKIEKNLLYKCEKDDISEGIMLKHIISLANNLGIDCLVEGVENIEHIELLKEYNCFNAQGYYFDKPMPVNEFESRLEYNLY